MVPNLHFRILKLPLITPWSYKCLQLMEAHWDYWENGSHRFINLLVLPILGFIGRNFTTQNCEND